MKEQILEALKTKYKNLGLSEKALDGVATLLTTSITEEAQIDNATNGVETMLKIFQSEQDALRGSKAIAEKQLSELKKQIETLGEKKPDKTPSNAGESVPEWAKALIESNKSLASELNAIKGEKVANARKSQLEEVIKVLPEQLRKPYTRMSFEGVSEEDFTTQLNDIKVEVEGIAKEMGQKGMVFGTPTNSQKQQEEKGNLSQSEIANLVGSQI